jgi:hypothetical protein
VAVGRIETRIGIQDCGGGCLSSSFCCNGQRDNDETGVDCGGSSCQPCNREFPILLNVQRTMLSQLNFCPLTQHKLFPRGLPRPPH